MDAFRGKRPLLTEILARIVLGRKTDLDFRRKNGINGNKKKLAVDLGQAKNIP